MAETCTLVGALVLPCCATVRAAPSCFQPSCWAATVGNHSRQMHQLQGADRLPWSLLFLV